MHLMTSFSLRGNQIGEALQFAESGLLTAVEIGRVFFAATDTVTITLRPGSFDAAGGFVGGNGAVTALSVTTAAGLTTTFSAGPDGLDVDPDPSRQGADFFYISEPPGPGIGGAYAGLSLEKLVVADVALTPGSLVVFNSGGSFFPSPDTVTPPPAGPGPIIGSNATICSPAPRRPTASTAATATTASPPAPAPATTPWTAARGAICWTAGRGPMS
jgi:hypothetical protein